jgi:hypothetical protein
VAEDLDVYVGSARLATTARIQGFNAKGEYIGSFGEEGAGEGQLKDPGGIALAAEGKLWVADTANSRVSGWKRTVSRTSYVQGAHGLVEQRSAGETSFPLPDAHGDITAIGRPGRRSLLAPEL